MNGFALNWTRKENWQVFDIEEATRTTVDARCYVPASGVNVQFKLKLPGTLVDNGHDESNRTMVKGQVFNDLKASFEVHIIAVGLFVYILLLLGAIIARNRKMKYYQS